MVTVLGLTLLIDFGFVFNGFETFTIFGVRVHLVFENPSDSGRVFGLDGL